MTSIPGRSGSISPAPGDVRREDGAAEERRPVTADSHHDGVPLQHPGHVAEHHLIREARAPLAVASQEAGEGCVLQAGQAPSRRDGQPERDHRAEAEGDDVPPAKQPRLRARRMAT